MTSAPKVLYLADSLLPPGGIQTLSATCLQIFDELAQDGHLRCACIVRNGALPAGVSCRSAGGSGMMTQLKTAQEWFLRGANLIFADHLYTARFAARIRAKHIFWAHLIEFDPPLASMHQHSMESSHRIICDSHFTLRHIGTLYPAIKPKLKVLHLGDIPRAPLSSPLYEKNFPKQRLTIIGRMAPQERYKGHDQIIEAMPEVLKTYPGCEITMIGQGEDRGRLEKKSEELGLNNHIRFLTDLDNERLFEVITSSCGILLPSLREAFGLVYLYALWAGIPGVAVRGTAGEEILGDCGVYAESQTPKEIAKAICRVLSGEWPSARAGQLRYDALFSYSAFKNRLTDLFTDLLCH